MCRIGEKLLERIGDHSREFTPLMDQVRISAVAPLHGSCCVVIAPSPESTQHRDAAGTSSALPLRALLFTQLRRVAASRR